MAFSRSTISYWYLLCMCFLNSLLCLECARALGWQYGLQVILSAPWRLLRAADPIPGTLHLRVDESRVVEAVRCRQDVSAGDEGSSARGHEGLPLQRAHRRQPRPTAHLWGTPGYKFYSDKYSTNRCAYFFFFTWTIYICIRTRKCYIVYCVYYVHIIMIFVCIHFSWYVLYISYHRLLPSRMGLVSQTLILRLYFTYILTVHQLNIQGKLIHLAVSTFTDIVDRNSIYD